MIFIFILFFINFCFSLQVSFCGTNKFYSSENEDYRFLLYEIGLWIPQGNSSTTTIQSEIRLLVHISTKPRTLYGSFGAFALNMEAPYRASLFKLKINQFEINQVEKVSSSMITDEVGVLRFEIDSKLSEFLQSKNEMNVVLFEENNVLNPIEFEICVKKNLKLIGSPLQSESVAACLIPLYGNLDFNYINDFINYNLNIAGFNHVIVGFRKNLWKFVENELMICQQSNVTCYEIESPFPKRDRSSILAHPHSACGSYDNDDQQILLNKCAWQAWRMGIQWAGKIDLDEIFVSTRNNTIVEFVSDAVELTRGNVRQIGLEMFNCVGHDATEPFDEQTELSSHAYKVLYKATAFTGGIYHHFKQTDVVLSRFWCSLRGASRRNVAFVDEYGTRMRTCRLEPHSPVRQLCCNVRHRPSMRLGTSAYLMHVNLSELEKHMNYNWLSKINTTGVLTKNSLFGCNMTMAGVGLHSPRPFMVAGECRKRPLNSSPTILYEKIPQLTLIEKHCVMIKFFQRPCTPEKCEIPDSTRSFDDWWSTYGYKIPFLNPRCDPTDLDFICYAQRYKLLNNGENQYLKIQEIKSNWLEFGIPQFRVPFCLPSNRDILCYRRKYFDVQLASSYSPIQHWFFIGRFDTWQRNPFCDETKFSNLTMYISK